MSSFGRPVLAVALVLMLAPLSRDAGIATTGAAGAGVELVYQHCKSAKPGQACFNASSHSWHFHPREGFHRR